MKKQTIEKNDQLLKKIGKYATAAGAVLLTGNLANAAVNVTTVNLDLQDGDAHRIDFDGDGLFEFVMTAWQYYSYAGGATLIPAAFTLSSSLVDPDAQHVEVIQEGPFAYDQWDPAALPLNHIIGPTLQSSSYWNSSSWAATIISTYNGGTGSSTWSSSTYPGDGNFDRYPGQTRYIGVRFSSDNTNWHYGWIAIQCNSLPLYNKSSIGTLISYGYETSANQSLPAGTSGPAVPLTPLASAISLGLVGLFGFFKSRRKRANS